MTSSDNSGPRRKSGKPAGNARSAARMAAVQALYQMDVAGTPIAEVIDEFVNVHFVAPEAKEAVGGADPVFFSDILRGVVRRQRDIDPMIDQALAIGWRLFRVDSTLRAILRAGVIELMERPDVPGRVVINEYINIAHAFFDNEEPRVVNGILDRLAKRLRPAEFEGRGQAAPAAAGGSSSGAEREGSGGEGARSEGAGDQAEIGIGGDAGPGQGGRARERKP